jgi:putative SOS response-associated peptidase YedK
MCYHKTQIFKKITSDQVLGRYGIASYDSGLFAGREGYHLNGFSHPRAAVVANDDPSTYQAFEWGLVPFWVKGEEQARQLANRTLNAKCETVFELPSFRAAIIKRRCIIPVDGFFEWLHFRNKTYPHFIYPKDGSVFSLGGIWEEWLDKGTGEIKRTYSVITTPANGLMEKIHNTKKRMPLVLDPATELDWLSAGLSKDEISALITPLDQNLMAYHTIDRLVSSRTEDSNVPDVIKSVSYPELGVELYGEKSR